MQSVAEPREASPALPDRPAATPSRTTRLDIQGLRAVAVVLVVLYHLWPNRIPGGYIGVDIFFVLSGFLITAHLLSEVDGSGTVSLGKFWARRVRRLLPAAFVVLIASAILAVAVMPRASLTQNLQEIAASVLYVENWLLASNAVDYLAAHNNPSLVQHYWSLSVEEQFYFVWPILIVAGLFIARRVKRSPRATIAVLLAVLFVASLTFSIWATATDPARAYFITPTRVWEFAAGGLLAFAPTMSRRFPALEVGASWVALAAILVPALMYTDSTPFPGWAALVPVLGAVVLIHIGDLQSRWSPQRLTHAAPVQLVGDTSYSIYLWHWPLIVAYPYVVGADLSFVGRLAVLAATLVLAIATKHLVEDPARFKIRWLARRRGAFGFMGAGILLILVLVAVPAAQIADENQQLAAEQAAATACLGAAAMDPANDCPEPFAVTETVDPGFAAANTYWAEGSVQADGSCKPQGTTPADCELGDLQDPTLSVAIIGNSHGEHLVEPLAIAGESSGWRILPYVRARCDGFEDEAEIERMIEGAPSSRADFEECLAWGENTYAQLVERQDVDVVLVTSLGVEATAHSQSRVDGLIASGKQVIMVGETPRLPGEQAAPECVERSSDTYDPCAFPATDLDAGADVARSLGVDYISLTPNFCDGERCHVVIGGLITFFDDNHMTLSFARTLAPYLSRQIASLIA